MTWIRHLYPLARRIFGDELFYKLRFSYERGPRARLLRRKTTAVRAIPAVHDEIAIIGAGMAALTLVRELHAHGFSRLRVIAPHDQLGGKCIHSGCMPSEFFVTRRQLGETITPEQVQTLGKQLAQLASSEIEQTGVDLRNGAVTAIEGKRLDLEDGSSLRFDHLVLATGSRCQRRPALGETLPPERFWEIEGSSLVLVSDRNFTALGYADLAAERGLAVHVLFEEPLSISHLPSFRYYQRSLQRRGIRIHTQVRDIERRGNQLAFRDSRGTQRIGFDHLLYFGRPELNLPVVDGQRPGLYDIDLESGALRQRPDIHVLGDAAGFLSATEAELHARQLARSWTGRRAISLGDLSRLPIRIHGKQPLAMLGAPWSYSAGHRWHSVDFAGLGWSEIHRTAGKLWYLHDLRTRRIEAIHICHRDAGELISIAAALLDYRIDDVRWHTVSVHPAAAEIFKRMIEQIERETAPVRADPPAPIHRLPPLRKLRDSAVYAELFSDEEKRRGLLDPDPLTYFSALYAVKLAQGGKSPGLLRRRGDGEFEGPAGDVVHLEIRPDRSGAQAHLADRSIAIEWSEETCAGDGGEPFFRSGKLAKDAAFQGEGR